MAIRLTSTSLRYNGSPTANPFRFFLFGFRMRVNSLASTIQLMTHFTPAVSATVALNRIRINTDGSIYYLTETSPISGLEWEKLTDPGLITAGSFFTLICYFDGSAQRIFKDDVEATYASTNTGGSSPLGILTTSHLYFGGDVLGPAGDIDLDEVGIWEAGANAQMALSKYRAIFRDGWSLRFFNDYLEGSTNRPGLIFYLNGNGDLTYDSDLLPINLWSADGVVVDGSPSYVEGPSIIYPASVRMDSEADFSPPLSVPHHWMWHEHKVRQRKMPWPVNQPNFLVTFAPDAALVIGGGRRKVGPPRRVRPDEEPSIPVGRQPQKYTTRSRIEPNLTRNFPNIGPRGMS